MNRFHIWVCPAIWGAMGLVGTSWAEEPKFVDSELPAQIKVSLRLIERTSKPGDDAAADRIMKTSTILSSKEAEALMEQFQDDPHVKNLCSPTVVTLDGHAATVQIGGEQTFLVGLDGDKPVEQTVMQGTQFHVTPRLRDDGRIVVELACQISRIGDVIKREIPAAGDRPVRAVYVPVVGSTGMHTTLALADGETALVGGLKSTSDDKQQLLLLFLQTEQVEP